MSEFSQSNVDDAFERLRDHQDRLQQARNKLEETSVSVTSKDRMVTATLAATGEITALTFHTTGYRSMAPAELSAVLVGLLNQARGQVADKVKETFAPFAGFSAALRESMGRSSGRAELTDALATLRSAWRSDKSAPDGKKQADG